jgi:competence protein ComEA
MLVRDKVVLAGVGASLILLALGAWVLLSPLASGSGAGPQDGADGIGDVGETASGQASPSTSASSPIVVVDLEGGVAEPGIQQLPQGSRIADAIVAAGGYSADADVAAAARALNLAALVSDGQQLYVPRVGESAGGGNGGTGGGGSGSGGLVNLNHATPEELDALPGIGPVTVQKIVAARQEQPFRSLDELVERKVLTASQLAKVRDQVTV